jgi:hypothetical protein
VFVLVFFSCSDAKLIPYILPALPTLALLAARPGLGEERPELMFGVAASVAASLALLAYAAGALGPAAGLPLAHRLAPVLLFTCAGLLCAAAGGATALRRRRPRAALAALCAGWLWTWSSILIGADRAASFFSAKDIALLLLAQPGGAGPGVPVYSVQSYEQSLPFYLGRTVVLVDYRDELDFGLRADPGRGIGSVAKFAGVWQRIDRGFAIMPLDTRTRLAALGVPMREIGRFADLVVVSRR